MLQKYRDRVKEGKTLWELLGEETSVAAETGLASLSIDKSFMLLSELYTRTQRSLLTGTNRQFFAFIIGITGYMIYLIGPFPRNFFVNYALLALIFFAYAFQSEKKILLRRQANILRLIPGLLASADRFALGSMLELAEVLCKARLYGNDREMRMQMQTQLSKFLVRTPTDALQTLSPRQRTSLCFLTEQALESCWGDARYEALAVAGLLTLTTLKDPHLQECAQNARDQRQTPTIQTALEEYLSQIAK